MNGGIINCAKYSFAGLLISGDEGEKHLDTLKQHLGLSNVFYLNFNKFNYHKPEHLVLK
jgi:hypothetical protein